MFNSVSFKGAFSIDLPNKLNVSKNTIAKYYDEKIASIQREKDLVMDTIEFMSKPDVKKAIKSLPEGDIVHYSPLEEGVQCDKYSPMISYEPAEQTAEIFDENGQYDLLYTDKTTLFLGENEKPSSSNIGVWLNNLTKFINETVK